VSGACSPQHSGLGSCAFRMNPPGQSMERSDILRRLRWALGIVLLGLVLSGITAFPLQKELERVASIRGLENLAPDAAANGFDRWILTVRDGLRESYARYPWLAYGTDWLAFGHLVIAIFFVGAIVDPVRNVWIMRAGLIACLLVIPLALLCGAVRQIPMGWRLMDCAFGVFGAIPLLYALRLTRLLEQQQVRGPATEVA